MISLRVVFLGEVDLFEQGHLITRLTINEYSVERSAFIVKLTWILNLCITVKQAEADTLRGVSLHLYATGAGRALHCGTVL